jgi:triacylglycerol lipase
VTASRRARPRPEPTPHTSTTDRPVVVVLHGLARTHRSVAGLRRAIEAAGWPTWSATYPSRRLSIGELSVAMAEQIQREAPAAAYHAVTHSMGGILVRHMRALLPWSRVVMMAPPNRGSRVGLALRDHPLYRWFYGPAGRELTEPEAWPPPPSPFAVLAGTRALSLGNPISWLTRGAELFPPDAPSDGTVSVEETKLPDMAAFAQIDASHTFIMDHPEARARTLAFLEHGRW